MRLARRQPSTQGVDPSEGGLPIQNLGGQPSTLGVDPSEGGLPIQNLGGQPSTLGVGPSEGAVGGGDASFGDFVSYAACEGTPIPPR